MDDIAIVISFALNIVLVLALIISKFIDHKSIDVRQVNELIGILQPQVEKTETQIDDIGLNIIKFLRDQLPQKDDPLPEAIELDDGSIYDATSQPSPQ